MLVCRFLFSFIYQQIILKNYYSFSQIFQLFERNPDYVPSHSSVSSNSSYYQQVETEHPQGFGQSYSTGINDSNYAAILQA